MKEEIWKHTTDVLLEFHQDSDIKYQQLWLHTLFQVRGSKSKASHEKVYLNCQYSMATFSTGDRKRRPRGDRKSIEMTMHLKQTFEAAIMTHLYPRSQIDIYVEVWYNITLNLQCQLLDKHPQLFQEADVILDQFFNDVPSYGRKTSLQKIKAFSNFIIFPCGQSLRNLCTFITRQKGKLSNIVCTTCTFITRYFLSKCYYIVYQCQFINIW